MFASNPNSKGSQTKAILGVLFSGMLSLTAQAQSDADKPNALVDYGEHHPLVFIIAILVVVSIAVVAVYLVFKKKERQQSLQNNGFSKPTQRTTKHPADRRYISKKSVPR
jgi:hypothetical protein